MSVFWLFTAPCDAASSLHAIDGDLSNVLEAGLGMIFKPIPEGARHLGLAEGDNAVAVLGLRQDLVRLIDNAEAGRYLEFEVQRRVNEFAPLDNPLIRVAPVGDAIDLGEIFVCFEDRVGDIGCAGVFDCFLDAVCRPRMVR